MRVLRSRRKVPVFIKVFLTVVAMACVSFGAAFAWQNAEDTMDVKESPSHETESVILAGEVVSENEPASQPESPYMAQASTSKINTEKIKTASEAAADATAKSGTPADGESVPPQASAYSREAVPGAVGLSAAVGYDYFDDAIFFGDSISTGIPLYMRTIVPNTAVIATQGVSPEGAYSAKCIDVGGSRVTMLEAAKTKGARSKVYIMLGANALDLGADPFIKGYDNFVSAVKAAYPDAIIYVQSMLPVTSAVNNVYPSANINNQRIAEYNGLIRDMALRQAVNYVDAAQAMVDANGFLPMEASPFDGMHLTSEYYIKWFDYLRTHTVGVNNQ